MSGSGAAVSFIVMKAAWLARALNGLLLTMLRPALARSIDEATALTQQVIELTEKGHYADTRKKPSVPITLMLRIPYRTRSTNGDQLNRR